MILPPITPPPIEVKNPLFKDWFVRITDYVRSLFIATSATATAGTNGALPAQVAGYITINVNNVSQKIPYYNL
jgi:hypothetical protein